LLSQRLPVWDGHCLLPNFGWRRSALFSRGGPGNPTMETTNRVGEASVGELFSFFLDGLGEKRILSHGMTNTAPTTEPAPMLVNNRP